METSLIGYVITGVVSLVVGLLLKHLEPKSKLCYWFPHAFVFDLKNENLTIQTNSLTVQNLGRESAEDVEIIHKSRPDFFQFSPPIAYLEETTKSGDHILRIPHLGKKEFFTLQLLSYKSVPVLQNIRSKDGSGTQIQFKFQRHYPKWLEYLIGLIMVSGLIVVVYWLVKSFIFLSKSIGLW